MNNEISYYTSGTCSKKIDIRLDGRRIESVSFLGGCPGNLLGIGSLVQGMDIEDVCTKLEGIRCGRKSTSCPDQLAKALRQYMESEEYKKEYCTAG